MYDDFHKLMVTMIRVEMAMVMTPEIVVTSMMIPAKILMMRTMMRLRTRTKMRMMIMKMTMLKRNRSRSSFCGLYK